MTKLEGALKRELTIDKSAYVLTISPVGFKLTSKGKRNGLEITWRDLVSGDAAMSVALRASLTMPSASPPTKPKRKKGN